jgi:transcriptional regulator with XRE-family HTH domain
MGIDGRRLKQARRQKGMKQPELAKKSGVSQSTISKLERGELDGSRADTQIALARALGVAVEWLLGSEAMVTPAKPEIRIERETSGRIARALKHAFDPSIHEVDDLDAVRTVVDETDMLERDDGDYIADAREWLNAAARIRRRGIPFNRTAWAQELVHGKRTRDDAAAQTLTADYKARVELQDLPPLKGPTVAEQIAKKGKR